MEENHITDALVWLKLNSVLILRKWQPCLPAALINGVPHSFSAMVPPVSSCCSRKYFINTLKMAATFVLFSVFFPKTPWQLLSALSWGENSGRAVVLQGFCVVCKSVRQPSLFQGLTKSPPPKLQLVQSCRGGGGEPKNSLDNPLMPENGMGMGYSTSVPSAEHTSWYISSVLRLFAPMHQNGATITLQHLTLHLTASTISQGLVPAAGGVAGSLKAFRRL